MNKVLMGVVLAAASGVAVAGGDDCWGKSKTMDAKTPAAEKAAQAEASKPAKQPAAVETPKKAAPKRDDATKTAAAKKPLGT